MGDDDPGAWPARRRTAAAIGSSAFRSSLNPERMPLPDSRRAVGILMRPASGALASEIDHPERLACPAAFARFNVAAAGPEASLRRARSHAAGP
ncbi:hypothetical protein NOVOSPHI9U_50045 [Novosphingobium sp. 9U]|nr:hypothetical protein NOVOSPHI9U_50045 [Novosphingobium sp. 9U]